MKVGLMKHWLKVVVAVLWSFLGIRKKQAYLDDAAQLKPQHLIVVGVLLAILFVVILAVFVNLLVKPN
jgi:hypothetical protein